MSFSVLFDCAGAQGYTDFLRLVATFGWLDNKVASFAWTLWNNFDYSDPRGGGPLAEELAAMEHARRSEGDYQGFSWRTGLKVSPGVDVWLLRAITRLGHALLNSSSSNSSSTSGSTGGGASGSSSGVRSSGSAASAETPVGQGPWDCTYGFLAIQYALLLGFQTRGHEAQRQEMGSSLIACMEVLLDAPYHTFDFLESSAWNLSSHDMAVNLDSEEHHPSFEAYAQARPLPAPRLPPWHAPAAGAEGAFVPATPRFGALQAAHARLWRAAASPLTLAFVQLHDGTAAELWASAQAALRTLAGADASAPSDAPVGVRPSFYFTQVKALRGTETGRLLESLTEAPFERLVELKRAAQRGDMRLSEVRDGWLPREAPALSAADLLVCSEPFWLCPLVAARRPGWMLGALHMALLNEFPFTDDESLSAFWLDFFAMAERRNVLMSVACRLTGEQVLHQTGVSVPYVPFLGLHVAARYNPGPDRQALLFRNNRQHMVAFRGALRLFLEELDGPPFPVRIVDMNEAPRALSFQEIASYHAVVLLPHGPNALRLSDLYAACVPMVVPGEPLVHKFVWASRTFGGYDADGHYRARAPEALRKWARGGNHPPYSPFNFLQAWAIHRLIDDRRYWYGYTEWATLPHIRRFRSLPELLQVLEALTPEEGRAVSAKMAQHHLALASDALAWWRGALGELLAGGAPE